jgi:hypothetical protein
MVQVDQDVAGISVCGIGLNVYVTTLAVANPQKSKGCRIHQLGRGPQSLAWEGPFGDGMNQTNQIQFVGMAASWRRTACQVRVSPRSNMDPILQSNRVAVQ